MFWEPAGAAWGQRRQRLVLVGGGQLVEAEILDEGAVRPQAPRLMQAAPMADVCIAEGAVGGGPEAVWVAAADAAFSLSAVDLDDVAAAPAMVTLQAPP